MIRSLVNELNCTVFRLLTVCEQKERDKASQLILQMLDDTSKKVSKNEEVNKRLTRDVQKIGPQLGISPISGHFWPKMGLGVENFQKLGSRLGLGLQN